MVATFADESLGELSTRLSPQQRTQLAEDVANLRRIYGPRWTQVPTGFGERASRARTATLTKASVAIDNDSADPTRLIEDLGSFVSETFIASSAVLSEVSVLGEVFNADLSGFALGRLRRLTRAVGHLGDTLPPDPSWADPQAAVSASRLLSAMGDDIREAVALHEAIYRDFTEDVWALTAGGRFANARGWRPLQWRAIRNELTAVTRSGQPPQDVKAAVRALRRAAELRAEIDGAWPALSGYLGWFVSSGLPDVDGATGALTAMHDLHAALGSSADHARLADLAAADAYISDEVAVPATAISMTIDGWVARAERAHVATPMELSALDLASWAEATGESLALLRLLKGTTGPLRSSVRSAGQILDDAIARDRIYGLCALAGLQQTDQLDAQLDALLNAQLSAELRQDQS